MKIFSHGFYNGIKSETHLLMKRMLNPLCGIVQQIGFIYRGSQEPRVFIAGVDLCGVHTIQGKPAPPRGAYHIGGGGVFADEAMIKSLGESVERYSQLVPEGEHNFSMEFMTYNEMLKAGCPVLDIQYLNFFTDQQLNRKNFPFQSFDADTPLNWVKLSSLIKEKRSLYIPMQLLFVGYGIKKERGERWLNSAVTTGTAAHVTTLKALKSALLEQIQLDAAMGHWYTNSKIYEINFDKRTATLERLIKKYSSLKIIKLRFYWLKSPDLKGFTIACLLEKKMTPQYVVGLGADTDLVHAMYKAYIEALGVLQLAKIILMTEKYEEKSQTASDSIFNLDANVALYARSHYSHRIVERFLKNDEVSASELPPDLVGSDKDQVRQLIHSFKESNKDIFYLDLTTEEGRSLGIAVARVWSPQLLSLAIPSAVPRNHSRFLDYGRVTHEDPHPYP